MSLTEKQLKDARKIADQYAKSVGKNSIDEVVNPIREGLESKDTVQVELAKSAARGTVEALTKLILRQEIFTVPEAGYMDIVNTFDDGVLKEGNAKLYDFYNPSGHDTYQANEFIPTGFNSPDVTEFSIKMYDAGGALSTQAYQFRKSLVYTDTK